MSELIGIRFKNNWADEFDVAGFLIMEEKEWEAHVQEVKEKFVVGPRSVGFGTNEDIEYLNAKDYLNSFTVLALTQAEIRIVERALGTRYFGIVPMLEFEEDEDF